MADHSPRMRARAEHGKTWVAVVLAWVGGSTDAVVFLTLFRAFNIAHMSGNTVATGTFLGEGDWSSLLRRAFPIPVFILGTILGATLTEIGIRRGSRRTFSSVLVVEALLLIAAVAYGESLSRGGVLGVRGGWEFYLLAALPTLSMGLQNATLRKVDGNAVHTTYITAALTSFGEELVLLGFWLRQHTRGRSLVRVRKVLRVSLRQRSAARLLLFGGIWLGYICGATIGAFGQARWNLGALAFPLSGLTFIIIWNFFRPVYASPDAGRKASHPDQARH